MTVIAFVRPDNKKDISLEVAEYESDTEQPQTEKMDFYETEEDFSFIREYPKRIASYIEAGSFEEASQYYQDAKSSYPQQEEVYLYAADIYLAQDDYEKAVEVLQEGMENVDSSSLTERMEYVAEHVNEDGSVSSWYESEYDVLGNMIKWVDYNGDGSIFTLYEYEYDASGNWTKVISNFQNTLEFIYDEKGNLIEGKIDIDGIFYTDYRAEYDEKGNLIKESDTMEQSPPVQIEYKYDILGNEIWSFDKEFADRDFSNLVIECVNQVSDTTCTSTYTYVGTLLCLSKENKESFEI